MGFKYTSSPVTAMSIIMDPSVVLGPIGMALLGFSLDLMFLGGTALDQIPFSGVSLPGRAVSFDKSPINLADLLSTS